jgi:hypothetical protein
MSYQFNVISEKTYKTWFQENYKQLLYRSPFHHPAWLKSSGKGVGFRNVYIGIKQGSDLVGAVPGYLARRGPVRLFGSPMRGTMTSYLGPLGFELPNQPEEMAEVISQCNEYIRKKWRVQYARFTVRNAPDNGKLSLAKNWKQQRAGSYRLNLSPGEEGVWKGLKSDCRRNIRKARKAGVEILPLNDTEIFFQMLQDTFQRHQTTSFHSQGFFQQLLKGLVPAKCLWPLSAVYKGQEIAVGLFLYDDREVHYISGASSPDFGNLPTSYLLHWHAIVKGIQGGLEIYNSDASRVRSIDRFKESYRPTLEKRYTLIWAPSYFYKAQKKLIASYHNLRRIKAWFMTIKDRLGGEA